MLVIDFPDTSRQHIPFQHMRWTTSERNVTVDLDHRRAVVTGAASGLGAATARRLAEHGVDVIGLDLPAALAQAPAVPGIRYQSADITDYDQVVDALDHALAGQALHIAVNCAGIGPSARILSRNGPHDPQLFATIVGVNLIGTFHVMLATAQAMAACEPDAQGQRGVIINTASVAAFDGQIGQAAYSASKGGVVALTLPAARDLAQFGIRVCTIAPGIIDTPMLATVGEEYRAALAASIPFPQRLGEPEEFASLVTSIIGNDYLNGEVIRFDGALRMAPR